MTRVRSAVAAMLAHPLARSVSIDDPAAVDVRRQIIEKNAFLRAIYQDWYADLAAVLPRGSQPVLELGSGAGFMAHHVPGLISSDVLQCHEIDVVLDACRLPFRDGRLRAIAMTNVLHHLPDVRLFFDDAARCVQSGGAIVMIEPWVTAWSRFVYGRLHHEPFLPEATDWTLPTGGPLSGANGALPWILFCRDRERFTREFPAWRIDAIQPMAPIRYVLSGGVSYRAFLPGFATPFCRCVERALSPWAHQLGLFARIVLIRQSSPA